MTDKPSPFVPGARVAVRYGHYSDWQEAFVDKVHKSGRFTLKGSAQQWSPYSDGWAIQTGKSRNIGTARIWNASTDEELSGLVALSKRRARLSDIQNRIARARPEWFTDAQIDQIEAALPKTGGSP